MINPISNHIKKMKKRDKELYEEPLQFPKLENIEVNYSLVEPLKIETFENLGFKFEREDSFGRIRLSLKLNNTLSIRVKSNDLNKIMLYDTIKDVLLSVLDVEEVIKLKECYQQIEKKAR